MKNKVFPITSVDINNGEVIIDTEMLVTEFDNGQQKKYTMIQKLFPGQFYLENTAGTDLVYNTYKSQDEYEDSLVNTQYYDFIPLLKDRVLQNTNSLRVKFFVIKKRDGSPIATTGIELVASNYRPY